MKKLTLTATYLLNCDYNKKLLEQFKHVEEDEDGNSRFIPELDGGVGEIDKQFDWSADIVKANGFSFNGSKQVILCFITENDVSDRFLFNMTPAITHSIHFEKSLDEIFIDKDGDDVDENSKEVSIQHTLDKADITLEQFLSYKDVLGFYVKDIKVNEVHSTNTQSDWYGLNEELTGTCYEPLKPIFVIR